jgi:hypothetical protein
VPDGLNRYSTVTGDTYVYNGRGNLQSDGTHTYANDVENRLLSASGPTAVTLSYDPLGRLQQTTAGSTITQFLYDGTTGCGVRRIWQRATTLVLHDPP